MEYEIGYRENYHWIVSKSDQFDLGVFMEIMPECLLGKYLAIICFDSGPFCPSEEETNRGWYTKNDIAYSPVLTKKELEGAIFDQYDQWCVFNHKTETLGMSGFVNHSNFTLIDKRTELKTLNPTWDKIGLEQEIEFIEELQHKFWAELVMINPDIFISNAGSFTLVSKDINEIEKIKIHLAQQ